MGVIEAEFDYQHVRRNVRKYGLASLIVLSGTFVAVWASWTFMAALAVAALMVLMWLAGALFALSPVPSEVFLMFVRLYEQGDEESS